MLNFAIQTVINGVALWVAAWAVPGITVGNGQMTSSTIVTLLVVALVFGLVNALIGPLLRLISLPLTLMTFGLFALVINAALLAITAGLTDSLDVGGFFGVVLGALVISIVTSVLLFLVGRLFGEKQAA